MEVQTVINDEIGAPDPFDINDLQQQPNLDYADFKIRTRQEWFDLLYAQKAHLLPPKPVRHDSIAFSGHLVFTKDAHDKAAKKLREFVNVWIDRFVARRERVLRYWLSNDTTTNVENPMQLQFFEPVGNGFRRGTLPTRVHYPHPENWESAQVKRDRLAKMEPNDPQRDKLIAELEDLSDAAISQVDWEQHPEIQEEIREARRRARLVHLTQGQLEELLAKVDKAAS